MKTLSVVALMMLSAALLTAQTIIPVSAGAGTISAAYAAAQPGDILELVTDGGVYVEPTRLTIDKALTIRAAAGLSGKPVWASDDPNYTIKLVASLTVQGIIFDGAQGAAKTVGGLDLRLVGGTVRIINCDFVNMADSAGTQGKAIYGQSVAQPDSVIITGCKFVNIAAHGILFDANPTPPGAVKFISIENSTFWKTGLEAIYIDDPDDDLTTPGPIFVMNHVTLHDTKRILTHKADYNVIRNTIFTNTSSIGNTSYYLYGDSSYVTNSLYYNAPPNMHTGRALNMVNADPGYKDPTNGDFTLTTSSPAYNVGDDGKTIGDPRWWPKVITGIPVEAGVGKIAAAYAAANPGDVLELVTDGGLYQEPTQLLISKPVTIRAASFVVNKPVWACDESTYTIKAAADLMLEGIVFDGAQGAVPTAGGIIIDTVSFGALKVLNCDFKNMANAGRTDGRAIYDNETKAQIDTVIMSDCLFMNIAKEGVRFGSHNVPSLGSAKYLLIEKSTFWSIPSDAIYVRDHDGLDGTPGPVFIVDHVTVFDASASYGILAHHIDGAVIKNCIASHSTNAGKTTYYIYGTSSILKNSLYWNLSINTHTSQRENVISADPLFVDPAAGNFMLYKNSPAVNAGDDGTTLGDPRWGVSTIDLSVLATVKKPYSMSPTPNSVRVVWQTPLNASDSSVVEYGRTPALGSWLSGPKGWLIAGEGYMHEVELVGLDTFAVYYYRVGNGLAFSETCMTKTAPVAGTNFRLMVGGDSRDNPPLWEQICATASQDNIDLSVHVGDYVTTSYERVDWGPEFFTPANVLNSKRPLITTIGNHETADGPPMTYYDYMSLPGHTPPNGENPESYYSLVYGDVRFIMVNSNGNFGASQNEEFIAGSPQYSWLQNELATATEKWVFVVHHTPVLSTSLHGQWTANEKAYLMPLYENYAASGKHILVFNGDDHNFEHLYKAGVNYFRPAGGGAPLYNNGLNTADQPWSVYFNMVHNYSTVDVRSNGDTVIVQAHLPTGEIFYETMVTTSGNQRPNVFIIEPDGKGDEAMDYYRITWADSDPDNDALIDLYYTPDQSGSNTLIVSGIHEDSTNNSFVWDVSHVQPGSYYIYAVINDGVNPPFGRYSTGKITVVADSIAPPPILSMTAEGRSPTSVQLSWKNPTGNVAISNIIATFDTSLGGFVGEGWAVGDHGSLVLVPGQQSNAMRMNYVVGTAWGQYGAFKYYNNYPNWSAYSTLDFWYRGDGSNLGIRLIVSQDNDRNGQKDDQWYTEAYNLSSTAWAHAELALTSLQDLGWDTDIDQDFDLQNIFSLEFIVPSGTPDSGYCELDEIKLLGEIPAAADFQGVVIVRKSDSFPAGPTDGIEVYRGTAETFIDSNLTTGQKYYYAAFGFDEVPNYSLLDSSSKISFVAGTVGVTGRNEMIPETYQIHQNYPNPFNPSTTIRYGLPFRSQVRVLIFNVIGQLVEILVDGVRDAGYHMVDWRPRVASGLYLYRIEATAVNDVKTSFVETRKMILLK